MNIHELIDTATIHVSALLAGDAKFFTQSIDSPPIGEVIKQSHLLVGLEDVRPSEIHTIQVGTPLGTLEAAYLPWRWLGMDYPTLLYHHGSGEQPFDFSRFNSNSFRRLFAVSEHEPSCNLVIVRAPFHGGSSIDYIRSMGSLSNFVGMLAASTVIIEALTRHLRERGCPMVATSGISLGGWVTNLHRAYFDTADLYLPIFAGAALGDMFISSVYRKMTDQLALSHPEHVRQVLDFEDAFASRASENCRPLLARYDRIIEFDQQRACYGDMDVTVLDRGHITGSLATRQLRDYVTGHL